MKTTRLLIIIILLGICGYSWYSLADSYTAETSEKSQSFASAQEYQKKGLWQLAIQSYQSAISQGHGKEAFEGYYESCKSYYAEDPQKAGDTMVEAFDTMTDQYPKNADYWEDYLQYYIDQDDYAYAGNVVKRLENIGVTSDKLEQLKTSIRYAVEDVEEGFSKISLLPYDGYYRITESDATGEVSLDGSRVFDASYYAMGQIGEDGKAVYAKNDGTSFVMDPNGIIYAKFPFTFENARGYGNDCVALQMEDGTWEVVNSDAKVLARGLKNAGMFLNGITFIQKDDGKYYVMDTTGKIGTHPYEDVRMLENGAYLFDDRIFLKIDGKWRICDGGGNPVSDFFCEDIDIYTGQPIAYCKDGKWGFVNADGTIYLEPAYEEARSFSNGVAAVKKDGKWGFIDPNGTIVVPFQYEDAGYFNSAGCCPVLEQEVMGYKLIRWAAES